MDRAEPATDLESPCQACGACCSYSANWPRFTTEDDAALDLIPEKFVNERLSGMRCEGDRCSALSGKVGEATACVIVPTVNPAHVTPHSEAFQAVIWHLLVSHPKLKVNQTKW